MTTLLILGAKPDPVLPPASAWDDLACANASGFSAAQRGLPDPVFTVITAMLTDVEPADATPGMEVEMVTRRILADGNDGPIVYGYKFRPAISPAL